MESPREMAAEEGEHAEVPTEEAHAEKGESQNRCTHHVRDNISVPRNAKLPNSVEATRERNDAEQLACPPEIEHVIYEGGHEDAHR